MLKKIVLVIIETFLLVMNDFQRSSAAGPEARGDFWAYRS
jgi:hypothetical protein